MQTTTISLETHILGFEYSELIIQELFCKTKKITITIEITWPNVCINLSHCYPCIIYCHMLCFVKGYCLSLRRVQIFYINTLKLKCYLVGYCILKMYSISVKQYRRQCRYVPIKHIAIDAKLQSNTKSRQTSKLLGQSNVMFFGQQKQLIGLVTLDFDLT